MPSSSRGQSSSHYSWRRRCLREKIRFRAQRTLGSPAAFCRMDGSELLGSEPWLLRVPAPPAGALFFGLAARLPASRPGQLPATRAPGCGPFTAASRVRYQCLCSARRRGTVGTTAIFTSLYRSYSTGSDGASDTTHTCCYGPLRVARRLVDVHRVKRGGWLR